MNGKDRMIEALELREGDAVPVFEWFIDAAVAKQAVGSDDPIEVVERLDLDAINVRADYTKKKVDERTFIDEWGSTRKLTGDVIAANVDSPIKSVADHKAYAFPDPLAAHRLATLEKTVKRLGDTRAVVFNLRDGFSDMRDLLGYENAMMDMLLEPDAFKDLLQRVVKYNLTLARLAVERYGVKIIATTDDVANADGMLIRPENYFEVLGPAFREIIGGYKELGCYVIKHCDGNVDAVVDFWIDCGIDCLDPIDPGAGYDLGPMKQKYGQQVALKGNVDCTGHLCTGTPEQVAQEVRDCIAKAARGGGYILSSSNTIHRGVKPENLLAMVEAARRYGKYPVGA